MKKIFLAVSLMAFVFSGVAQNREKRNVAAFTKISFKVPGKLFLKQGSTNSVELEADKETLEKIEVDVVGGKLVIGLKNQETWFGWRDWDNQKINAYITISQIEGLSVSGAGEVIAQTRLTGGSMTFNVSGAGSIEAEIDGSDVSLDVSGAGKLNLKGKMKTLDSDISGAGKISFDGAVLGSSSIGISGAGKFSATGSAQELKANISGAGKILASDFAVEKCHVKISGSGDAEVNVKTLLDTNVSGAGSVLYKGNPSQVNSHSSGAGRIRKM